MKLRLSFGKKKNNASHILLALSIVTLSGCMKYSVDISKDRRVSSIVGHCYVVVRKLKIYQPLDETHITYIASGGANRHEKVLAWVPEGTKLTVRRVDEYHHPTNGVFYDPIIEVTIEGNQYLAKGWQLFSNDTDKDIQPEARKIQACPADAP
jgi:hypothetical protein